MAPKRPSKRDILRLTGDVGPEDGLDPRFDRKEPGERAPGRKTLQLCRQVAEALMAAMAASGDDVLRDLEVAAVAPAGGGRLLVTLRPAPSAEARPFAAYQERLAAAHGMLRNETAAAVHRRKAPDLVLRMMM